MGQYKDLSKPEGAPAVKLLTVKQTREIRAGRLDPANSTDGLELVPPRDVNDVAVPRTNLDEGACAALAMRWLRTRLEGREDKEFLEGRLDDLGQMQRNYLEAIRESLGPPGRSTGKRGGGVQSFDKERVVALTNLAEACGLTLDEPGWTTITGLMNLPGSTNRSLGFKPGTFAADVARRVRDDMVAAWWLGFTWRPSPNKSAKAHAIGIFITDKEREGLSSWIVFDPNAGVYRLRDGAEAKREFFNKLETIYAPTDEKAVVLDTWTKVTLVAPKSVAPESVAPESVAPEAIAEGAFKEVNLDDLSDADIESAWQEHRLKLRNNEP